MKEKIIVIVVIIILFVGTYFGYKYSVEQQKPVACTMEAKICPDGSAVGRVGPKCEFESCPISIVYRNEKYGFEMTLRDSWQGYTDVEQSWQGNLIDNSEQEYSGPEIIIKNPKTTFSQKWQNIPIMVFTPDVWKLIQEEKIAVSAAPIGPEKIGENAEYIFATPPRWYGFTDDLGWQEAVDAVKTFKAY